MTYRILREGTPGKALPLAALEPLRILAYFDVFHYPLSALEIRQYSTATIAEKDIGVMLGRLLAAGEIFYHHGFYSLHDNPLLALRRREGNERAEKMLPLAFRAGRFLACFPFVRSVCISGSLSKHCADEKADIDFFIITRSNRLWLARTVLHLFKKLSIIAGRQHMFCMNYFLDEEALLIEDQNVFTALEIKTLLPVSGTPAFRQFLCTNDWGNRFYPRLHAQQLPYDKRDRSWLKPVIERIFAGRLGEVVDNYCFRVTTRRWKRKEERNSRNEKGVVMHLSTGKHFARSNPGAFQEWVLDEYNRRLLQRDLL